MPPFCYTIMLDVLEQAFWLTATQLVQMIVPITAVILVIGLFVYLVFERYD